ncbi:hypothetical protein ACFB49_09310 [Sphingomonas sp. DBB INV C78]
MPLAMLAASILCLGAMPAAARTNHDAQLWVNLTAQGSISGKLVYFAEIQPRLGDRADGLDQLLLRPAVGWKLAPNLTAYQGYARVISPVDDGADIREHRSFQQLSWIVARPWGGEFSSRTRLEQRWRSDGDDMGWRLREMARLEVPLAAGGKTAALGYAEGFVALNSTDWGAKSGFDQLRVFAGAEIGLRGASTIELGYLNQLINQRGGQQRVNHVLSVSLFLRH